MTPQQFILSTEYKDASESARYAYDERCALGTEDNGFKIVSQETHLRALEDMKMIQRIEKGD